MVSSANYKNALVMAAILTAGGLLALLGFLLNGDPVGLADGRAVVPAVISRQADPVVVDGSSLSVLEGVSLDEIFVYASRAGFPGRFLFSLTNATPTAGIFPLKTACWIPTTN